MLLNGYVHHGENLPKSLNFFRSIVIQEFAHRFNSNDAFIKFAKAIVNRSCGQLQEFSYEGWNTTTHLSYVADQPNMLKRLQLENSSFHDANALVRIVKQFKFPLLVELELRNIKVSKEDIIKIGSSCQQLKNFWLIKRRELRRRFSERTDDDEASTIAESMPQLCRLTLQENHMTNDGLQAILDGCPQLEYLDLLHCYRINLETKFITQCLEGIKDARLLNDPIFLNDRILSPLNFVFL
ncbi:hypothetical protein IFM89_013706 [Coptis chinensis]|uniref:F-box/LRR-repeat protein 15/At3g58940/PEG3-like LRR domain-containing protein n=1 Tax=Coptis chinensis TaxID=261450 RepID=A0A835GXC5_9MAGN|nr:hypothetical protein IFM89_013706 [Coptis chinensis]